MLPGLLYSTALFRPPDPTRAAGINWRGQSDLLRQVERDLDLSAAHNFLGQEEVNPVRADIRGFRESLPDILVSGPTNNYGEMKLEPLSAASLFGWQRDTLPTKS